MTTAELKAFLEGPLPLLGVMLFASCLSMFKQVIDARRSGSIATCRGYLSHWPETVTSIGGNILAFGILVATDQLNFASAIGVGFGVDSLADLVRAGGRSASLRPPSDSTDQAGV